MKVMLTSFGIGQSSFQGTDDQSIYYMMPPVSLRSAAETFMPDYEILLLCDQVAMDGSSYNRLAEQPASAYSRVSELFQALKAEGRIVLTDFQQILAENADLHSKMVEHDLKMLDQWVPPLRDSRTLWSQFASTNRGFAASSCQAIEGDYPQPTGQSDHVVAYYEPDIPHLLMAQFHLDDLIGKPDRMIAEALESSTKRRKREYRDALRAVLTGYLGYVNANLIIANQLNVGFHDWHDFFPFYNLKFLSVGQDGSDIEDRRSQIETLFSVPFPDLAVSDPRALLRALNDKRIEDLRKLIDDAVAGRVTFDNEFAKAVLAEVLHAERRTGKLRNVVGYATAPIGFIPWLGTPAQKLIEEAVGKPLEKKLKQKHRWFYMLSDIAESQKANRGQ